MTEENLTDGPPVPDPDQEMLDLVRLETERRLGQAQNPHFATRRIKDSIFQTIEQSEREAQMHQYGHENLTIPTDVRDDPVVHQEDVSIPTVSAIAVLAGAEVAHRWNDLPAGEREAFRQQETARLIAQVRAAHGDQETLMKDPIWRRALREFVSTTMNGHDSGEILLNGIPPNVRQSDGQFSVEVLEDHTEQIGLIVRETLHRLHHLCADDRKAVRNEISGWEKWRSRLIVPQERDIPQLNRIYDDVRIPYEWFQDLVSSQHEIREAASAKIRNFGGFIHPPSEDEYRETMQHGVMRMTNDGTAYYGILTEDEQVLVHLREMCGYDPQKQYRLLDDLPEKSDKGYELEWNADPALALSMFQHPHQVALSVEVAVMREQNAANQTNGRGRRNAGVAAALKHSVYTDPKVDQAWVLTRHFQIVDIGLSEIGKPPEAISGAINVGSDVFIRMLAGREIGSMREKCTVQVPDKQGHMHPVDLTIRWILCLAPRKASIEAIEGRGSRT